MDGLCTRTGAGHVLQPAGTINQADFWCSHGMTGSVYPSPLQVLPWAETPSEAGSRESWRVTLAGSSATADVLAALLAADKPARAAVLRDGSWDAAAQRVR